VYVVWIAKLTQFLLTAFEVVVLFDLGKEQKLLASLSIWWKVLTKVLQKDRNRSESKWKGANELLLTTDLLLCTVRQWSSPSKELLSVMLMLVFTTA